MDKKRLNNVYKAVTAVVAVAVVVLAVWIMAGGRGLSAEHDFGAGAYYYADIPGFEKLLRDDIYTGGPPLWLCILLFLAWGALMYRLWKHLDK